MAQSNITKANEVALVETRTEGNAIVIEFGRKMTSGEFNHISNQLKEVTELLQLGLERNRNEIQEVKKTIETNYITPEELRALESIVDEKARKFVDKSKGIQINIDILLNNDVDELIEYQKLVNDSVGKTKSKIWVDLHKKCLEQKGTTPKNRILATQVKQAFDYVRTWGGFSV